MKHPSYIKNYEGNFESLAEEIGDLRYDSLFELLELLSRKIEKDGQKDRGRGRTQLADSLQQAATVLQESAEHIKIAWQISEPFMYPKDITKKIKEEFKTKADRKVAFQLLSYYYRDWGNDPNFRLARCLLHETHGNLDTLKRNIKIAQQDPRDIMAQAEYDEAMNRLRNYNRAFGEDGIIEEDFRRDVVVLDGGDDLPF